MRIEILRGRAEGRITAPPSKSMAHRMLICAGLAVGESVIHGIAPSEDMYATLDCLSAIGARAEYDGSTVRISGIDPHSLCARAPLACRECGSTLRFFVPIAWLSHKAVTLSGSQRLLARPLSVYEAIAAEKGLTLSCTGEGITVSGPIKSGVYTLPGNVSSQFISGLLFVLPLLPGDSRIEITGKLESRPYIDLTLSALRQFGVTAEWEGPSAITMKGGQRYRSGEVTVEGDYSNAAFFAALDLLGGRVEIDGLSRDSLQGDRVYTEDFAALVSGAPTLSIAECPDLGPILMAVAAAKNGATFTDTARLRIKESDRGAAMAEELQKFGVSVTVLENEIILPKSILTPPREVLSGHNDHRIVMALAVLATLTGGVIDGAEAVRKSMPGFFSELEKLGVKMYVYDT